MLTLVQTQAISELAQYIYDFLPATPHPFANQDISFKAVALSLNLGKYWTGGSKLPAISQILSNVLEYESNKFCQFILETVRRGITYRRGKGNPITREEIETLNEIVARVGFKIPELHDSKFLDSLPHQSVTKEKSAELSLEAAQELQRKLIEITKLPAQERGFKFEAFLQELFTAYNMLPRSSFRNIGEQIDGSMVLDNDTYLIEAKWQNAPIGQEILSTFSDKVRGKAEWSRGLLISYSTFSSDGLEAFSRGKQTNIICMDSLDLHYVLQGKLDFKTVLQRKARRAAETNEAFVSVRELFPDV